MSRFHIKHIGLKHGWLTRAGLLMAVVAAIGGAAFGVKTFVTQAAPTDYTATAAEITAYLNDTPGASFNDILNNFSSDTIIELPAGNYQLSDNLIVSKRLIIRGADNTTPDQVVIDGQSHFSGGNFNNGYFIDLAYASAMIEGVTLTHLGTSVIDYSISHDNDMPAQYTGYSIAVRGGTLNRNIIVDNAGLFPDATDGCQLGGAVVALFSGTLSGNLIAHNGINFSINTPPSCYYNNTREIVFAMGTSHLIGNTIANNVNDSGSDPWINKTGYSSTVNLWDDPILENNVIVGSTSQPTSWYGDGYQVLIGFHNTIDMPTAVGYKNNWIHKDTENNIIGGNGADLFANFPASQGATVDGILPSFDYRPKAGSALINAGTDVFYPVIPQDLSGNSHYLGAAPDLGAYESSGASPNFTKYPSGVVYVTEHGAGNRSGTSWANAIDGNAAGGPQNALIAAVRGGAHQVWFAEGNYNVLGREYLYTRAKSSKNVDDNFVAGTWGGLLIAPSYGDDDTGVGHMQIYGGFVGGETSADDRPSFKYENSAGTEIGTTLRGSSANDTTHFIGERGYAADGASTLSLNSVVPLTPMQPDYLNLINQDPATLRKPTLPSQGVHVISQVEYAGVGEGAGEGEFRPLIDGVEVSNGFSAIYSQMLWGTENLLLDTSTQGGAGIFLHGGIIRNSYIHDNYDAVTTFMTWFMSCGGGIFMNGGTIDNAVVTDNVSETTGGGILLNGAQLLGSYVAGNYAFKEGGGVHTGSAHNSTTVDPEITNTVITDNHTLTIPTEMFSTPSGNGGGLWMSDANYTKVRDVTIYGNSATAVDGQETTTGLGDNIYFAGGDLTNVVAMGSAHASSDGYSKTICYIMNVEIEVTNNDCSVLYGPWPQGLIVAISGAGANISYFLSSTMQNIINGGGDYNVTVDIAGDDYWMMETFFSAYLPEAEGVDTNTFLVHTDGHVMLGSWPTYSSSPLSDEIKIQVKGGSACTQAVDYTSSLGFLATNIDNEGRCVVFLPYNIESIADAKQFLNGQLTADSDVLFAYVPASLYTYDAYWTAADLDVQPVDDSEPSSPLAGTDIYVADDSLLDKITYSAFNTTAGSNGAITLGTTNLTGLSDADAVFEDVSTRNFRLAANSPLIGKGTPIAGINYDVAGALRQYPSIGAYTALPQDNGNDNGNNNNGNNGNNGSNSNNGDADGSTPGTPDTGIGGIISDHALEIGLISLAVVAATAVWASRRLSQYALYKKDLKCML
ncbi:MAG: hypothetical protein LBL08_01420 [Candidatus Nomurabacteria bacterium]|jgi:hypothetical protein|nr:hypothetical protein [Candidatus Nomurabacteria bacterium]